LWFTQCLTYSRNGLLELHNSIAQAELAQQQVTVTDRLRQGEYQRFEAGASDMFRFNIREQMAALFIKQL